LRTIPIAKLLIVFAVALSLATLTGPMSSNFHLPAVPAARALPQVCDINTSGGCSEYWLPAGPAEDTLVATIFTDEAAEFTDIQSATPHIDMTDWPLTPDLTGPFTTSSNFRITSTISADVNFEIQFMLANNLWGVNLNYGNDPNGISIRQGVAHMIDTAKYAANEPSCSGQCIALDTPNPPDNVGSLPAANSCLWDSLFPQTGAQCIVGAAGGSAYHLGPSAGANGNPAMQRPGSLDLNAAAAHFVAAGVATGCDGGTGVASCVSSTDSRLSGISAAAAAHTVNFFIRNDNPPRLHLGDAYAAQICWIFTGSYTVPCLPYLSTTHGPITAFPGFTTSTSSVNLSWGMYTAEFGVLVGVSPFDSTYYFIYNSIFASGIPSIQPPNGPCSAAAVPTVSAADYMYLCNQQYDALTSSMEFAPCLSVPGQSPAVGETTTTYGACTGTGQEQIVNDTANTGIFAASDFVYYGLAPAVNTALHAPVGLFWTCDNGYTYNQHISVNAVTYNDQCVKTLPGGNLGFHDATLQTLTQTLRGHQPNSDSNGITETPVESFIKFVDVNGNGVFDLGTPDAFSAGVQAADNFGAHAFTIETFTQTSQFGYLNNGWIRVDNSVGSGLPGFWTWLNAWNPSPAAPGTIRQGYKSTTTSVSPFIDSTLWDGLTVGDIYDSLGVTNPLNGGQLIDYMALSVQQLPNSALTYTPPGPSCSVSPKLCTTSTFRYTLRSDMFFQDGRKVTSFDVAFSYLALKGTGAFVGGGAAPMSGITILGPTQVDINVNAFGPFTLISLSGLPVMPGAYWSNAGSSAFTSGVSTCTATGAACYPAQYTIGTPATTTVCALTCAFPASLMNVNVAQTGASYDPITAHTLVGSSGWECGTVTSSGSGSCSSSGTMNPPVGGSYVLSRFGKGLAPASSVSSIYFRSNGNLAAYLWSQNNGDITHDFLNFSVVASCFGASVTSTGPCAHFQQGIGANGGPVSVGLSQVAIVNRFVGLNWIAPFNWATTPPLGILPLPPVLYENTITLNPAAKVGCTTPYPTGGYDC